MLDAARRRAGGRPLLLAATPHAPAGARPVLTGGERRLPGRLAPWTLLDLAAELHVLGDELALLGLAAAGVVSGAMPARLGRGGAREPPSPRCSPPPAGPIPFRDRPWTAAEAIAQLADWRVAEAANRRIVACTGIEWFKHRRLQASAVQRRRPAAHPDARLRPRSATRSGRAAPSRSGPR